MKKLKHFAFALAASALAFTFTSCGSDDPQPAPLPPPPPPPPTVPAALFLVGDVLGAPEWDYENYSFIFFRDSSTAEDVMITNFLAGEFQFLEGEDLGSIDYLWGGAENLLAGRGEGPRIPMVAGHQRLVIDRYTMTYTIEAYDNTDAPVFNSIGLIGAAAGGWGDNDDVLLTQSTRDPNIWYGTDIELMPGAIRFRTAGGWDAAWSNERPHHYPFGRHDHRNNYEGGNPHGNSNIPAPGRYFVKINTFTGHFVYWMLESMVIDPSEWSVELHGNLGGTTGWYDFHLEYYSSTITNPATNAGTFVFRLDNLSINAGSQFGVRIANNWFNGAMINITGDAGNFSHTGGNITVESAAVYNVTLTLQFNGAVVTGLPVVNFAPVP